MITGDNGYWLRTDPQKASTWINSTQTPRVGETVVIPLTLEDRTYETFWEVTAVHHRIYGGRMDVHVFAVGPAFVDCPRCKTGHTAPTRMCRECNFPDPPDAETRL